MSSRFSTPNFQLQVEIDLDLRGEPAALLVEQAELGLERRDEVVERHGIARERDEQIAAPIAQRDPGQPAGRRIETLMGLHQRRAEQLAVEPVAPAVIRAAETLRVAAALRDLDAAMQADIGKRVEAAGASRVSTTGSPRMRKVKKIAGVGQLLDARDQQPVAH